MRKQSPYYLKKRARPTVDVEFTDPVDNPDNCFALTLRRLTSLDVIAYLELAEQYVQKYVTGIGEEGKPGWVPPQNLPPCGSEPVTVTPATCRVIAAIEYAQAQPEEDRYRFEELAAMCSVDAIAEQMLAAFVEIQKEAKDGPANPPTEPTCESSRSQEEGSSATQRSSSDRTPSSARSTNGSEPLPVLTAAE